MQNACHACQSSMRLRGHELKVVGGILIEHVYSQGHLRHHAIMHIATLLTH